MFYPLPCLTGVRVPPVLPARALETTATVASLGSTVYDVVNRTELQGGRKYWHVMSREGRALVWPSVPPRRAEVLGAVIRQVGGRFFFTWRYAGGTMLTIVRTLGKYYLVTEWTVVLEQTGNPP